MALQCMSRDFKNYHKHLKCFGSTFLLIQICSKLIFTTRNYQLQILCFSYDTPLHLLGFVSAEDDVVMDEKREKRKINCGKESAESTNLQGVIVTNEM